MFHIIIVDYTSGLVCVVCNRFYALKVNALTMSNNKTCAWKLANILVQLCNDMRLRLSVILYFASDLFEIKW